MILKPAWRLLRVKNADPWTLFHGFHGSRRLPYNKELRAIETQVWNPGKKGQGPGFISGWHVILDRDECIDYLKRFTDKSDLIVAKVYVARLRKKPRATSNVHLARYMKIDAWDWAKDKSRKLHSERHLYL